MAYQTGNATGVVDLLDKLKIFVEANGWTTNRHDVQGSGRRLQIQKSSDLFFNFRALVSEARPSGAGGGSAVHGIAFNGSTEYDGANDWFNQVGAPQDSGGRKVAGVTSLTGSIPAYHFFAIDDAVYCWIEYTAGRYQWFGFGGVNKIGTWTGRNFFFGYSNCAAQAVSTPICPLMGDSFIGGTSPIGYVIVHCDGYTGWRAAGASSGSSGNLAGSRVFDVLRLYSGQLESTPNNFNSLSVILPVSLLVYRDANNNTLSPSTPIGYLPELHYINIKHLVPGAEYTLGGDTYRVFPFSFKSDTALNAQPLSNGYMGVAIRSN